MIVPQLDLGSEYQQLRVEIDVAVQRVLVSGNFIGGAENDALERELADYIGVAEWSVSTLVRMHCCSR